MALYRFFYICFLKRCPYTILFYLQQCIRYCKLAFRDCKVELQYPPRSNLIKEALPRVMKEAPIQYEDMKFNW